MVMLKCIVIFLKDISPIVSAFMPLIVILISGWWLNKRLEKIRSRLQLDHAIIQKRAKIYSEIQNDINTIYSYIKRVGYWKELTPEVVLKAKRKVDQKFHTTKPYWSADTFRCYENFMNVCFETYRGHAKDAAIIANIEEYNYLPNWLSKYTDSYANGFDEGKLIEMNSNLMSSLSKDFGIV